MAHGLRLLCPAKGNTAFNSAALVWAGVGTLETAEYKTLSGSLFCQIKLPKIAHHVRDVTLELHSLKFPSCVFLYGGMTQYPTVLEHLIFRIPRHTGRREPPQAEQATAYLGFFLQLPRGLPSNSFVAF